MEDRATRIGQLLDRLDRALLSNNKWLFVLFLLPFVLKCLYVLQSADSIQVRIPIMDGRYYDEMAQDIASGNVIRHGAFFMGPLYPYFLALVYSTVGRDLMLVRLLQIAGGSLSVVLTYLVGKRLFRPSTALLGAVFLVFYGTATFYEGHLLMMWMGTALNLGVIVLLLRISDRTRWPLYAAAGLLLGLSALARANILIFFPIAVAWIVAVRRPPRRLLHAAVFTVATLAAIAPATIHNYIASRDFVLVTSNAGLNFYIGNNEMATGVFYPPPDTDFVTDATTRSHLERLMGRDLTPSEVSAHWFAKSKKFIRESPMAELKLLGRKFALFFNGYEIPQIESYDIARERYATLRILFLNFWFLGSLGVLGMIFAFADWRKYLLAHGYVVSYALSIVVFFVTARYRVQIVPVLALFAAYTILDVVPRYLNTVRRGFAVAGTYLVLLLLMHPSLFAWDEKEITFREQVHEARRLSEIGEYKSAIAEIDSAIQLFPKFAEGYLHRAIIHKEGNDLFKAIEDYSRALDLMPNLPGAHYDLAQTFRQVNLRQQAIVEYQRALQIDPLMIEAYNNMGITYSELKQYDRAIACFERVLEVDPRYVKAYNNLGAALAESGRHQEAIDTFNKAVRLDPAYANTYKNLAMAYVSLRQVDPAIQTLKKYLALNPSDQNARGVLEKLYIAAASDTATASPSR